MLGLFDARPVPAVVKLMSHNLEEVLRCALHCSRVWGEGNRHIVDLVLSYLSWKLEMI